MVNLMNDPKALGAMLRKLKDEDDLNTQMKKLETVFSILARSTGRRIPFVIREGQEEEQVELPVSNQQSALPPVPVAQGNLAKLYQIAAALPRPAYNWPRSYPPAALRGCLTATVCCRFSRGQRFSPRHREFNELMTVPLSTRLPGDIGAHTRIRGKARAVCKRYRLQ